MVMNCKHTQASKHHPRNDFTVIFWQPQLPFFNHTFNRILFYSVGHFSWRLVEGGSEADGMNMFTDGITGATAGPVLPVPSFSQQDLSLIL